MAKLEKDMSAIDFCTLVTNKTNGWKKCVNCTIFNGKCVDAAKDGKCKAYNFIAKKEK